MVLTRPNLVDSLSKYISFIEENISHKLVLFRGQAEDLPLLPRIARLTLNNNLIESEPEMLNEFKMKSRSIISSIPKDNLEWLALARHYGMPTRLLDWTTNPLAALWFAVRESAKHNRLGIVWAFKVNKDDFVESKDMRNPFKCTRTSVFQPSNFANRISAQSSWFTLHYSNSKNEFYKFETLARYKSKLSKILIKPEKFSIIQKYLSIMGINSHTMLSDLDGLCQHIEWEFCKID